MDVELVVLVVDVIKLVEYGLVKVDKMVLDEVLNDWKLVVVLFGLGNDESKV